MQNTSYHEDYTASRLNNYNSEAKIFKQSKEIRCKKAQQKLYYILTIHFIEIPIQNKNKIVYKMFQDRSTTLRISMRGPPTSSRTWYSIVGGKEIHVKTNPGKKITLIIVNVHLCFLLIRNMYTLV